MTDRFLVDRFVTAMLEAQTTGISEEVDRAARRQLLDSVGVSIAAQSESTVSAVEQMIRANGSQGDARTIGHRATLTAQWAALLGGTLAHALDFDDTHGPSVLHPSASVIPAAIAAASESGATIQDTVNAIAAGNELVVRLGMAGVDVEGRDSIFFRRGFHATSICGTLGAALAASLLTTNDADEIRETVSIASSFSSGLLEANRTGGTIKRVHCGWAAFGALTARELARTGVTGAPTFLEGRFGFLNAFCGSAANPEWLTNGLGEHWEMTRISFKPYPTNGFATSVVDAAVALRESGLRLDEVIGVEIRLPPQVLRTVAEPPDQKAEPTTTYGARFSAPFVFALALRGGGGLGLAVDDFTDETITDRSLLAVARRVDVIGDDGLKSAFPGDVPAHVIVETAAGKRFEESVPHRRGGVNRPLTDEELSRKFDGNASVHLESSAVARLKSLIIDGSTDVSIHQLLDLTVPFG